MKQPILKGFDQVTAQLVPSTCQCCGCKTIQNPLKHITIDCYARSSRCLVCNEIVSVFIYMQSMEGLENHVVVKWNWFTNHENILAVTMVPLTLEELVNCQTPISGSQVLKEDRKQRKSVVCN